MLALIPILLLAAGPVAPKPSASTVTPQPATVRAYVVEETIQVVTEGRPPVRGSRTTLIASGRIRRESSLDSNVILLRAGNAVPLAIIDQRAKTWFGYEAGVLAKADMPGPLLEGIGIDGEGQPFGPEKPFRPSKKTEQIGPWKARLFTATERGAGGMETDLWLADRPGGIPNDAALSVLKAVYSRKGGRLEPYFAGLGTMSGFPVRSVFRMTYPNGMRSVATITITKISEEDVPAARFEIPKGTERVPDPVGLLAEPE